MSEGFGRGCVPVLLLVVGVWSLVAFTFLGSVRVLRIVVGI